MRKNTSNRPIDNRFVPAVTGIDLEQALNYIDVDDVGESFAYERYTSRHLFYTAGARPELETAAASAVGSRSEAGDQIRALAHWVAGEVKWAGYYQKETGSRLPPDRNLSEESLIHSKYGWCNEQARVFCLLAQVVGIPSRLIFASNPARSYGHCIAETLTDQGWMAVDPSFGFCFEMDGDPVRACDIFRDPDARSHFESAYRTLCRNLRAELGPDMDSDFAMAVADNPLDGFSAIGVHNYFAQTPPS